MRQRVAAALDSSVRAGRSSKSGRPAIAGGELQPLAGLQIELVDHAGDGGRRRRTQRFLHGPQGFFAVRGLDQDQAGGIETETVQAMTVKPAMVARLGHPWPGMTKMSGRPAADGASIATMKPKAAGNAACLPARFREALRRPSHPPGDGESRAARPKGRAVA